MSEVTGILRAVENNLVAAGAANDDVVSTLASRLARLDQEVDPIQQAAIHIPVKLVRGVSQIVIEFLVLFAFGRLCNSIRKMARIRLL